MRTSLFICAALAFLCGCRSSTSDTEPHLQSGMLQYYYLDRLEKNLQNCRERINKAQSREDALKLVAEAGKKVAYAFKNVPLRQRVESTITGVEHFDGYKAQKLLIRTRENFTMTATLFLPDNGQKIFPAVIFLAGHAKKYLERNFASPLHLEDLAQHLGISKYHLSRLFHTATGFSFREYLSFIRLQEAKKLLADERSSISEIAQKCGFDNGNYFSKVFRSKFGISPGKFRELEILKTFTE